MALTATVADVSRSIRAVDSPDVLAELEDLLAYASAEVTRIAPLAPDVVHNRAATASSATYMTGPQQDVRCPMRT